MIQILSDDVKQLDLSKELVLTDATELPFTSLLLKNGTQKATSTVVSWDYEKLDDSRGLAKEGSDVEEFQISDRTTGNSNVCQILRKAVNVSDTALAVTVDSVSDLFAHELTNRISEIKRDLEYYLINGIKNVNTTDPRQMDGLLKFVSVDNKIEVADTLDLAQLQAMAKKMRQRGTASQNLALLCDYNTFDIVSDLFADKTTYIGVTNDFGSPVKLLNLTYATIIPYIIDTMPTDTCLMANMDYLKLAELRPLTYNLLAKTGSSTKGFIEMENSIKVLHPDALVEYHKTV